MSKDVVTGHATVTGFFDLPSRCSKFKVAVVHYYRETIVVQPILQSIGGRVCGKTLEPSEFKVELKNGLKGTYLLHVRSMNSQAINRLVDIK